MNGAVYITRFDGNKGFHQLELDEESREITIRGKMSTKYEIAKNIRHFNTSQFYSCKLRRLNRLGNCNRV